MTAARHAGLPVVLALAAGCGAPPGAAPPPAEPLSAVASLSGAARPGFARATEPRPFVFPRDHGPHPDFQTEWWYFTGNLTAEGGRRFGYQLTFFRSALAPPRPAPQPSASAWWTRQLWMAHLALTDAAAGRFHAFERFGRGALELAGGRARPFAVWLENWSVRELGPGSRSELPRLALAAATGEIGLELELEAAKPLVAHGDAGLSRKGRQPGSASYYYSATRLATAGSVRLGADTLAVRGSSWLDREWSTSVLEPGLAGWDWFSLQLDDGRELMFYVLRRDDGSVDPVSAGTLVAADGSAAALAAADVEIEALARWSSPATGARYPAAWRLTLPGHELELALRPLLADQEHRGSFVYWEGAVEAAGTASGRPVTAVGYVELTGYGEPAAGADGPVAPASGGAHGKSFSGGTQAPSSARQNAASSASRSSP